MPRPVAPVRSTRRAFGLKMRRANSPSGRKPITRRSKPHGNGRRRPLSRPTMASGRALRARTHRPSGGVVYDDVARHRPSQNALTARPYYHGAQPGARRSVVGGHTSGHDTTIRLCNTRGIGAYGGAPENSPSVSLRLLRRLASVCVARANSLAPKMSPIIQDSRRPPRLLA
jgi:hypothetical protein